MEGKKQMPYKVDISKLDLENPIPEHEQQKMRISDYWCGNRTVAYYADEEFRYYPLDPRYCIGNRGSVYSLNYRKKLNSCEDKDGYLRYFVNGPKGIHRLMMQTFNPIPNDAEMQINHIDGHKKNNNLNNLEWCTCQENIDHAVAHGLRPPGGEKHHKAIYKEDEIRIICGYLEQGYTGRQIAAFLNREYTPQFQDLMTKIRRKISWAFISKDFPGIIVHHKNKNKK